jgi:hypothetical protein
MHRAAEVIGVEGVERHADFHQHVVRNINHQVNGTPACCLEALRCKLAKPLKKKIVQEDFLISLSVSILPMLYEAQMKCGGTRSDDILMC